MRISKRRRAEDGMRAEYDFSGGVRGKYAGRLEQVRNVVVLDPDVARLFRTSAAVNAALRSHLGKTTASRGLSHRLGSPKRRSKSARMKKRQSKLREA
jgi:hypothetical protein